MVTRHKDIFLKCSLLASIKVYLTSINVWIDGLIELDAWESEIVSLTTRFYDKQGMLLAFTLYMEYRIEVVVLYSKEAQY